MNEAKGSFCIELTLKPLLHIVLNKRKFACRLNSNKIYWGAAATAKGTNDTIHKQERGCFPFCKMVRKIPKLKEDPFTNHERGSGRQLKRGRANKRFSFLKFRFQIVD